MTVVLTAFRRHLSNGVSHQNQLKRGFFFYNVIVFIDHVASNLSMQQIINLKYIRTRSLLNVIVHDI